MRLWSKAGLQPQWGLCPRVSPKVASPGHCQGEPDQFSSGDNLMQTPCLQVRWEQTQPRFLRTPARRQLARVSRSDWASGARRPDGPSSEHLAPPRGSPSVKQPVVLPPPQVLEGVDAFQLRASLLTPGNSSLHVSHQYFYSGPRPFRHRRRPGLWSQYGFKRRLPLFLLVTCCGQITSRDLGFFADKLSMPKEKNWGVTGFCKARMRMYRTVSAPRQFTLFGNATV